MADLLNAQTCWRVERAHRVAFLVDGERYFEAVVHALRSAKHSVHIIGWDLHSQVALRPRSQDDPCVLVDLLRQITAQNHALDVRVLIWDPAPIMAFEREFLPLLRLSLGASRVHMQLAADHPQGATHHQKVVVIDDALAFVGGLDFTINRWDDRSHRVNEPARVLPNAQTYDPFHDVQLAVDGDAAAALAELARERWRSATGKTLRSSARGGDPWPTSLRPDLREVDVGISRTQPATPTMPEAREVEALSLAAINSAQRCIYIENQYITASTIRDALCAQLQRVGGPEVIILTPNEQAGPLERLTMGVLRTRVLRTLRAADVHDRLRVLCPTVTEDQETKWVQVHSKVMAIDESLLVIGSANLCNRSMSLDTECNLALQSHGADATARAIRDFRDGLLAEHLGVEVAVATKTVLEAGSLRAAIERLSSGARTLAPVNFDIEAGPTALVPLAEVVDAVRPVDEALVRRAMPDEALTESRRKLPRMVLLLVVALALAAMWTWTPVKEVIQPERLFGLAAPLRDNPLGPVVWAALFALISLAMVPLILLTVVTVMLFGTWKGFLAAMVGSQLGAMIAYGLGRLLLRDTVRRLTGQRLDRLTRKLASRGWLAIFAVRMVPVAPFTVVNLVAGSSRIRPWDFFWGTLLGLLPGTLALALAADRVAAAASDPTPATVAVAAMVLLLVLMVTLFAGKLLERARGTHPPRPSGAA